MRKPQVFPWTPPAGKMKESILNARMPQFLQHKKIWLTVVGIFAVIAALFIGIDRNSSLMLTVDGQALAVVAGEETVNQALDSLKTAREKESGVTIAGFSNELAYAENPDSSKKPVSAEALAVLLKDKLEWESACWAIKISGKPDLYFKSEADAGQALEMIKEYYLPKEGAQQIEHIAFAEDVDIQQETTVMNALLTPETAVDVMVKGLNKIIKHTVQNGDTLWAIAKNNNMTVDELKEINTELKSDFLKLGQELNLVKVEPLLTVVATVQTTVEEKIPYNTTYESDETMWRGTQKVKKPGETGAREVTYRITKQNDTEVNREVIAETVLTEPVAQVVIQGTKTIMASRGDGGTGKLAWPLRGRINSPYGRRASGIHTGIDIDGVVGDPIYSAEAGIVLDVRYQGNYGKCIIIDHGNGLSTLYAHLKDYNVSPGQKVSRGDFIGLVGLTGRTTGSHLHFEVRVNGKHTNPMSYLN